MTSAPRTKLRDLPPQLPYIIGNEGCERFSFYGMRNILVAFLTTGFLLTEDDARARFHLFVSAVYFFPLLGGYLADRFWGKYHTILWLSIVYCLGHLCLALAEHSPNLFYFGLFLIALGSGGIKPCVSAFVGDQFTQRNKHLARPVFEAFYWIINFGSFFASLCMPKVLRWYGPSLAFGIPGILMLAATVIFWRGRNLYTHAPPTGRDPGSFLRVVRDALRHRRPDTQRWLDGALAVHPAEAVEGARAVFRILRLFAPICVFWALFDQKASTWILQANRMDRRVGGPGWSFELEASQLQLVNPCLVMLLVPLLSRWIYPAIERAGLPLPPLRRMTIGMFVTGLSFLWAGWTQSRLDAGETLSVLWQLGPYLFITLGEVLVSVTGLEFAYSQAPPAMKGIIMSFWSLTVTIGNLLVALVAKLNVFSGWGQYAFYVALIWVAATLFGWIARHHVMADYYGKAAT